MYFVLDIASKNRDESFYRLVDAIGGENRAFVEFRFKQDSMFFDAYKDNSGRLDIPELHMSFKGANRNSQYASNAIELFDFPSTVSEVNLTDAFDNLVDPDSALFLEETDDPFPKSDHGYVSDLTIDIIRDADTENQGLFLFISKEALVSSEGIPNVDNIDNSVIRTIQIRNAESNYVATYLHPDDYYLTVFMDNDNNGFPSTGDRSSGSVFKQVRAESVEEASVELSLMVE